MHTRGDWYNESFTFLDEMRIVEPVIIEYICVFASFCGGICHVGDCYISADYVEGY